MASEEVLQLTCYADAKVVKALPNYTVHCHFKSIGAIDTKLFSQY